MLSKLSFYLSISLIGFIGFLPFSSQAADFKPSSAVTALMPIVMDNLDTLNLSQAQLDQVREVARKNFAQLEFLNAQYHELKTELKEETLDVAGDIQKSRKLIEELGELDKQKMNFTIECVFALKRILTAEQYEEVIATLNFND